MGTWLLTATALLGVLLGLVVLQFAHLAVVLAWCERRQLELAYYGLPAAQRRRFKAALRWHGTLLTPIVWLLSRVSRFRFADTSFAFRGTRIPKNSCNEESVRRAVDCLPEANDVFVVSQMRSGTTWTQHLVYQVLTRGQGDLAEDDKTLYAVSPWLESRLGVPVDRAPLIGAERPSRIVKTHLPADLCPFNLAAKYIYVRRDPVACFGSCVDFVQDNVGAFAPEMPEYEGWFTSADLMWWSTWPAHVGGWSQRAAENPNVLVIRFEDMKRDLAAVVGEVAALLDMEPLSSGEMAQVLWKCSFDYMRDNADRFEMMPPHVLQGHRGFFISGKRDRRDGIPADVRERVGSWCDEQLQSLESCPVVDECTLCGS